MNVTPFFHFIQQKLQAVLQAHREQANEYTHYSDPNHGSLVPLQSILMNAKKEELLNILSVYLVNTNARVDFYTVGSPPLHMAIAVSGSTCTHSTLLTILVIGPFKASPSSPQGHVAILISVFSWIHFTLLTIVLYSLVMGPFKSGLGVRLQFSMHLHTINYHKAYFRYFECTYTTAFDELCVHVHAPVHV